MDVYALDENFNLVAFAIPYTNLQWTRRYYDFGEFEMQIPLEVYDATWQYIGTAERPELGMIQKISENGDMSMTVLLSGFFIEKMLDEKACYPRYIGDDKTETALRKIFTRYKDDIPIILGPENSPLLGDRTQSNFSDDKLGTKLFRICEPREISWHVTYDYAENQLYFSVWQGVDRTQEQDKNPYYTFSLEFGNIGSRSLNIDYSNWYNYAIIPCNGDDDNIEQNVYYVDLSNGGYKREIVLDMRMDTPEENESMADFQRRIEEAALEKMVDYQVINTIDLTPLENIDYMTDYDLGDKCSVELSDINVSLETRIVEVYEVFKDTGHTVTVGLGNKRITKIGRALL